MCFSSFFWNLWSSENVLHVQECTAWSWSEESFATDISRVRVFFQEVIISDTFPFIRISQLEHRTGEPHRLGATCRLNKPLSHSLRVVCHDPWVLSAELLPTCSALRVSISLASAYHVKDFAFAFALLPSCEVCAGHALKGVSCTSELCCLQSCCGCPVSLLQISANGIKGQGALDKALKSSVCSCPSGSAGNISHCTSWAS